MTSLDAASPPATRFSLDGGEGAEEGIGRVLVEQVELAAWHLTRPDIEPIDVHEARKACKRIRAIARLVRDDLDSATYRETNLAARNAARVLSPARSTHMVGVTLREVGVAMGWDEASTGGWSERFAAAASSEITALRADPDLRADHALRLANAAEHFARRPRRDAFVPTESGLGRVYRRGRSAMAIVLAAEDPSPERFHEWRKRVKYLQYHTEFLAGGVAGPIAALAVVAAQLSEELGLEHDLTDLHDAVTRHPSIPGNAVAAGVVLEVVVHRRAEHRRAILLLGSDVYREKPKAFVRHMTQALVVTTARTQPTH